MLRKFLLDRSIYTLCTVFIALGRGKFRPVLRTASDDLIASITLISGLKLHLAVVPLQLLTILNLQFLHIIQAKT